MCLVGLAIDQSRRFPLVLAVGRDHDPNARAARLAWWSPGEGLPDILGAQGRNGAGWLGLTAQGRLAVLTERRKATGATHCEAPPRGEIVPRWLAGDTASDRFWMRSALEGYDGFNLLAADFRQGECFWASSQNALVIRLERGLYGFSDACLNERSPGVMALRSAMQDAIIGSESTNELATQLFDALSSSAIATSPQSEPDPALSALLSWPDERGGGAGSSTLVIAERVKKRLITHVLERSFSEQESRPMLRRSLLKDWPPRHKPGSASGASTQQAVTDVDIDDLACRPTTPAHTDWVRSEHRP